MPDYIIDTNVWVWADQIRQVTDMTPTERDCVESCFEWLNNFIESQDRLVVDDDHRILTEYYDNTAQGGDARQFLRHVRGETSFDRLVLISVQWDEHDYAIIPTALQVVDPSDRKFIAVALAHDPRPSIVVATDRGWAKWRQELEEAQIVVEQLCEEYMRDKLERRGISP
jgi:hypothetical protein